MGFGVACVMSTKGCILSLMLSSLGFQNWLYKLIIPYHQNQKPLFKNIILSSQRDGKKELIVFYDHIVEKL
jgi:hypothetical protein